MTSLKLYLHIPHCQVDNALAKLTIQRRKCSSGFFRGPMTSKITSYFRQHNLCCILMHRMVMSYLVNLVVLAQKSCLPAISCISMLTGDEKEIFRTHRNHNQTQTVAKFVSTTQGATKVMNSLYNSKRGLPGRFQTKRKLTAVNHELIPISGMYPIPAKNNFPDCIQKYSRTGLKFQSSWTEVPSSRFVSILNNWINSDFSLLYK